jgi:hypothetical protein
LSEKTGWYKVLLPRDDEGPIPVEVVAIAVIQNHTWGLRLAIGERRSHKPDAWRLL